MSSRLECKGFSSAFEVSCGRAQRKKAQCYQGPSVTARRWESWFLLVLQCPWTSVALCTGQCQPTRKRARAHASWALSTMNSLLSWANVITYFKYIWNLNEPTTWNLVLTEPRLIKIVWTIFGSVDSPYQQGESMTFKITQILTSRHPSLGFT